MRTSQPRNAGKLPAFRGFLYFAQAVMDAGGYREEVGLTVKEASRRAGVGEAYLRRAELHGCSWCLANRLARLYQCPLEAFLPRKDSRPTTKRAVTGQGRRNLLAGGSPQSRSQTKTPPALS
jgi:hypothetical protein